MLYTLVRTTPQGAEKTQGPFPSRPAAAKAAGRVLNDNARVEKAEAQRFSASLAKKDLGTEWVHAGSGYRFRIEKTA